MAVSCRQVRKVYEGPDGGVVALEDATFHVADHEFVCIVGPSGCGKTTLLKILGGLVEPTTGVVEIRSDSSDDQQQLAAMVFQDHGLYPWLDVLDNIAFGLEARGVGRRERRDAARSMLDVVGLSGFAEAYPNQLSGGMQQRVGIARALLVDAPLLLMDEPFGALDAQLRRVMQEELLRVWQDTSKQVVYVTHDIDEALRLGDRVLVMSGHPGRIVREIEVPLSRPRDLSPAVDHELVELRWTIWNILESEVRELVSPTARAPSRTQER